MLRRPAQDRSAVYEQLLAVHADGCSEAALSRLAVELMRMGEFAAVQVVLGDDLTGRRGKAGSRNALRSLASAPGDPAGDPAGVATRSWLVHDPSGALVGELTCLLGPGALAPAGEQQGLIEQVCTQLGVAIRHQQLDQLARNGREWLVQEQVDRRLAERAFDLMFDESPIGMATLSLASETPGLVIAVNEALCQLLGRTAAELLDHVFMVLIHPDDRAASNSAMRRAMAGRRTPVHTQPRLLDAEGALVPVQLTACPLFDDEDRARYALLQVQDLRPQLSAIEQSPQRDPLVGLLSGADLDRAIRQCIDRVRRLNTAGVALVCDLDELLAATGRATAEVLRQSVAGVLRQSLRGEDLIGRISQNRFVVLADEVPAEHAETVGRRITDALQERGMAVQIGIALLTADVPDGRVLVKRATSAMFGARTAGLPYQLYTLNDGVLYSSTETEQVPRQVLYAKPGWREA
ncbi:MAG: PAS domain S-box protein [Jatrophihabitantaceae bacterium]